MWLLTERQFAKLALKRPHKPHLHVNRKPAGGQCEVHPKAVNPATSLEIAFFNHGRVFVDAQTTYYSVFVAISVYVYSFLNRAPDLLVLRLDVYGVLIIFNDLVLQEELQLLAEHRLVHHGHSSGAVRQGGCVRYGAT